jgi:hypothetical protein
MTQRIATLSRAGVPQRHAVSAAVAALLAGLAVWLGATADHATPVHGVRLATGEAHAGLLSLPAAAQGPVSSAIGAADPAFRIAGGTSSLHATNSAQGLRARFDAAGVRVQAPLGGVGLELTGIGFGASLHALPAVTPRAAANRVVYSRAGVSESYANGPLGIEQGFVVPRAPAGAQHGPLTLAMRIGGDLHPTLTRSGTLDLSRDGQVVLRYGGLAVTDARGRAVPARLQLDGGRLYIRIDAGSARYPLRIDPVVAGEKLAGGEATEGAYFGRNVALSTDGSTALIGGSRDGEEAGAAWVFVRSGATWVQQGPKITPSEEEGKGFFGQSVALSSDGNTAIVGGNADNFGVGAAWVFTRSGATWTQQGPKLLATDEVGKGHFGDSVAISGDGNTAIVVGAEDNEEAGAAWVFARSEGAWSQQGHKITGATGAGNFGTGIALSEDGGTALLGSPADLGGAGAVRVLVRSGEEWKQQGPPLTPSDELGPGAFGQSIALTADGSTALISAYRDNEGSGAVWTFKRSGETWSQVGSKITAASERREGLFGAAVALSSDGSVALVGGPRDHGKHGAVWTFAQFEGHLVETGVKLVGAEEGPEEEMEEVEPGAFGRSVALSGDGTIALVGAPRDNENSGFAWVFVQPEPKVTTGATTSVTQTSAVLNGIVNPEGAALTGCRFEYGVGSLAASVPCVPVPGPEARNVHVSAAIAGLTPGVKYRYRVVASNIVGTSAGEELLFMTAPEGASAPPGEQGSGGNGSGGSGGAGGVLGSITTSGGGSSSAGTCQVRLASRAAIVPGGIRVGIKLQGRGTYAGPCTGTLRLIVKSRVNGKVRRLTIGAGSFSIRPGKARYVRVRLNARGRLLLAAGHGRLNASVSILKRIPGPAQAQTASVHIAQRLAPAKA